jgi:hypothetical protein
MSLSLTSLTLVPPNNCLEELLLKGVVELVKFILPQALLNEKGDYMKKVAIAYFMVDLKKSSYIEVLKMYQSIHRHCLENNLELQAVYHDIRGDFSEWEIRNATKRSAFQDMQKQLVEDSKIDKVLFAELWNSDCDSGYFDLLELGQNMWLQSLVYVDAPELPKEAFMKDGIPF